VDATLIAVGSELLRFGRRDTNGDWLSERLNRLGFEVRERALVEDVDERIVTALQVAAASPGLIVLTGGLGPTEDDRTRHGLARMLGVELERDPEMVEWIRSRFVLRGIPFRASQSRQADRPRGTEWLANPLGAAPGIFHADAGRIIAALPGVPAEMKAMFRESLAPKLAGCGSRNLVRRTLKIAGRTESSVDAAVRDLYGQPGTQVTILTARGEIELHLRAEGGEAADAGSRLDALDAALTERLGDDVYGRDDETLAGVTGTLLQRHDRTLAVAESCTAGLLAGAITAVPGSSAWFRGGWIVYSNDLKQSLAGVSDETLRRHGAVSAEVARDLATAVRRECGADLGVGITGIAGPGGGSAEKPVGRVHLALADADGVHDWRLDLGGGRDLVRVRAVAVALDKVRRRELEQER
jgi:nicotinamide-nucleotide amidase